jgi:hypothetical protein
MRLRAFISKIRTTGVRHRRRQNAAGFCERVIFGKRINTQTPGLEAGLPDPASFLAISSGWLTMLIPSD